MAITFPASPTNGQTFTSGNKTWQWDGTTWLAYGASLSPSVLKVDAANARVGVNNQSPAYALDVNGTIEGTQFLQGTDYLSPYQGFRNLLINGAMNIWQRSTNTGTLGLGGGGYYGADRWWLYNNGFTTTMSRQLVGSTLPTFLYCMRLQRTSGQTSTTATVLHTPQETINSVRFAGKQATLSFYARASSGMSNTSGVTFYVNTGTGTDQSNLGGGAYTGLATPIGITPTLTTSWQRFTATGTIASTTTEIDVQINYVPTGTAGASDYFEFTGIQLEEGSVATPFEHRPIQQELALCQRYYEKSYDLNTAPGTAVSAGWVTGSHINTAVTTSYIGLGFTYKVSKRATPTVTIYDPNGNINACQRWTLGGSNNNGQNIVVDGSSGQNNVLVYSSGSTSNAGIGFHFVSVSEL